MKVDEKHHTKIFTHSMDFIT